MDIVSVIIAILGGGGVLTTIIAWRKLPSEVQNSITQAASAAVETQEKSMLRLDREIDRLTTRMENAETIAASVPGLQDQIRELKEQKEESDKLRDARIAQLEKELKTEQCERKKITAELKAERAKNKTLDSHLAARDARISQLEEDVAKLQQP